MKRSIMTAAAVMSAAVMLCGCSAGKSAHNSGVPDKPETWSVEQRSLDDVTPMEGETQVFVTRNEEDDTVRIIQGILSDDPVNDARGALDLIASYSQVMGFVDVYSELQLSNTIDYGDKMEYRFDQFCDGMKAGFVEIMVDRNEANKAVVLNSNYIDLWGFNTKPKVSALEAVQCAADKYKTEKNTKAELVIYEGPLLAWKVPVKDGEVCEVYINATNGEIAGETLLDS